MNTFSPISGPLYPSATLFGNATPVTTDDDDMGASEEYVDVSIVRGEGNLAGTWADRHASNFPLLRAG